VLDFGVAKMLGEAQVPAGAGCAHRDRHGHRSPPYMAEQLEGSKDVDLRRISGRSRSSSTKH